MIISPHHLDLSMLAFGRSRGPSPIQLAQRQLPRSPLIELVRDGVHWPSGGVDMDVGQPEQPLQRALLNTHRLRLGMWHDVA